MADLDRQLLAALGSSRPRVAILPTASYPTVRRCSAAGPRWASSTSASLGAEVEAVLVRDASDARDPANAQAVGEADLIYLSGGKPDHLLRALAGSPVWAAALAAHARGAALVGCSAGAMVLASRQVRFRRRLPIPRWAGTMRCAIVAGRRRPAALRPVARAVRRADGAAGAARTSSSSASTRTRRWSGATAAGRSTAGRGSRSGAGATASDCGRATSSGPEARPPSEGARREPSGPNAAYPWSASRAGRHRAGSSQRIGRIPGTSARRAARRPADRASRGATGRTRRPGGPGRRSVRRGRPRTERRSVSRGGRPGSSRSSRPAGPCAA